MSTTKTPSDKKSLMNKDVSAKKLQVISKHKGKEKIRAAKYFIRI
jgi:hypothetical protein